MQSDNILTIQEMLMKEMKRLDDDKLIEKNAKNEIARSNALSQSAMTFIKTINVKLRVMEVADKNKIVKSSLNKELGVYNEK